MHSINMPRGEGGAAKRVTIEVGPDARVYENRYVWISYEDRFVNVYETDDPDSARICTAPLERTVIEWL
jgi:hypothetical protein